MRGRPQHVIEDERTNPAMNVPGWAFVGGAQDELGPYEPIGFLADHQRWRYCVP